MTASTITFPSQWRFVPIHKGGKNPIGRSDSAEGWKVEGTEWGETFPLLNTWIKGYSANRIKQGKEPYYNTQVGAIGVICGESSGGLLLLDHDGDSCDEILSQWGELPETWMVSSGKQGHYQLVFWIPEVYWPAISTKKYITGVVDSEGKHEQVELRWNGCQSLVWGEHPESGNQYQWIISDGEIAEAPIWLIEKMLKPEHEHKADDKHQSNQQWSDQDWAKSYLDAINPDPLDWYTWRNCLFAAHAAGLSENDVMRWSAQSSKHTDKGFSDVWRHIKGRAGFGIGTLGYLAKQDGWKSPFAKTDADARKAEFNIGNSPKTLKEAYESVESQDSGYAALRLAISDILLLDDPLEREYKLGRLCGAMSVSRGLVRQIVNDITRRKDTHKTSFLLADFIEMANQGVMGIEWLIPNYLPQTGLTIMGGFAKDGKTTFLWKMCESLLSGSKFLNEIPNKRCKVLFIECEESSKPQMMSRLESVGLLHRHDLKQNLRVEHNWAIDDLATLETWIIEHQADVIFIDSLRKVSAQRGVSENSQEYADPVYELQGLINKLGKACIILHHTNKNKEAEGLLRFAGSSALLGATDNLIGLSKVNPSDKNDPRRKVDLYGRSCKGSYIIEWVQNEPPQFDYNFINEIGVGLDDKNMQEKILHVMKTNMQHKPDGMTASYIKSCLDLTPDDKSVYRPLTQLVDKQIVSYRREGRTRLYFLTQSSPTPPTQFEDIQCDQHTQTQSYQDIPESHSQSHQPIFKSHATKGISEVDTEPISDPTNLPHQKIECETIDATTDATSRNVDVEPHSGINGNEGSHQGGEGGTQCASPETLTEILGGRGLVKVGMWYEYCLDHLSKAEQAEWMKNRGIAKLVGRVGKVNRLGYNEHGNVVAFLTDPYNEPFSALPGCLQAAQKPEIKPDATPKLPKRTPQLETANNPLEGSIGLW